MKIWQLKRRFAHLSLILTGVPRSVYLTGDSFKTGAACQSKVDHTIATMLQQLMHLCPPKHTTIMLNNARQDFVDNIGNYNHNATHLMNKIFWLMDFRHLWARVKQKINLIIALVETNHLYKTELKNSK